mmetsp:Transcript_27157/g.69111  ORF Transcript_27157/g.69111 Transcript_27157/m.69111 type:complete len:234 (+) Transcript_27157:938-1639(+)
MECSPVTRARCSATPSSYSVNACSNASRASSSCPASSLAATPTASSSRSALSGSRASPRCSPVASSHCTREVGVTSPDDDPCPPAPNRLTSASPAQPSAGSVWRSLRGPPSSSWARAVSSSAKWVATSSECSACSSRATSTCSLATSSSSMSSTVGGASPPRAPSPRSPSPATSCTSGRMNLNSMVTRSTLLTRVPLSSTLHTMRVARSLCVRGRSRLIRRGYSLRPRPVTTS